jgi:hypothetical protein
MDLKSAICEILSIFPQANDPALVNSLSQFLNLPQYFIELIVIAERASNHICDQSVSRLLPCFRA